MDVHYVLHLHLYAQQRVQNVQSIVNLGVMRTCPSN